MSFSKPLLSKAKRLVDSCREQGLSLAVAESCTGGLLAGCITELPGVSDIFMGGAVTYSNAAKHEILHISASDIDEYGAVSAQTAKSMAYNTCTRFDVGAAVAITGIAGPSGGTPDKPVGTVDIATAIRGRVVYQRHHFEGNRHSIRLQAVETALDMLLMGLAREAAV